MQHEGNGQELAHKLLQPTENVEEDRAPLLIRTKDNEGIFKKRIISQQRKHLGSYSMAPKETTAKTSEFKM